MVIWLFLLKMKQSVQYTHPHLFHCKCINSNVVPGTTNLSPPNNLSGHSVRTLPVWLDFLLHKKNRPKKKKKRRQKSTGQKYKKREREGRVLETVFERTLCSTWASQQVCPLRSSYTHFLLRNMGHKNTFQPLNVSFDPFESRWEARRGETECTWPDKGLEMLERGGADRQTQTR